MKLDTNHGGDISREEARKWADLAKVFDPFDANHDGKISRQESRGV
jgi:Ca2+-binding EF-hand superfamily protein